MHWVKPGQSILATALLIAALYFTGATLVSAQQSPPPATPMNRIVQERIYPQLEYFFHKLNTEKARITLDGQAPFQSNDKFLPGKIAAGLGDVVLNTTRDDKRLDGYLRDFRAIADMTAEMDNHTWGIYYYLSTLVKLKNASLLDRAVSAETLTVLKKKLDWRGFVRQSDFSLIDLPTNYYGVAFSVARLRTLLGWEDESASKTLMAKMLEHYAAYSGTYGFSDETPGAGRFDRYSILLIAEICERLVETGMPVSSELKVMLRKAADIALNVANTSGEGLSFGRSIGPYGETAMLEILSISAYLDVLTAEEKPYAYAYATRIVSRYSDFWFDPATRSVDLWGQGRRTDAYRAKHRNLGENFSLLHQLVVTNQMWNKAGFENQAPKPDLQAWLDKTQPPFSLTWFARGEYDRALAIFRDRQHVLSLLMVNGGPGQHANSPYYPLPFSNGLIAGTPDSGYQHAQLLPKFTLADGSQLIGTAFIKDIRTRNSPKRYAVSYRQDELDRLGDNAPVKDTRIKLETEYLLEPGMITCTDKYTATAPLQIARVDLEFASFSDQAKLDGLRIHFAEGDVTDFEVTGLDACQVETTHGDDAYKSPNGPMKTHVSCASTQFTLKEPLAIKWVIRYH
jgi:hypothetical protein